ncbi:MAG: 4-alpha-glucanotransferase, partial [Gammaproteobacteria bacterium]|nr:4-alpha-glucanotransferase [Gammaproteobacteria bacterium]
MTKQQSYFLDRRRAGVLLHPTSIPGQQAGNLGPNAFRFIDFLVDANISVWQTLPLSPTHADGSPYNCLSAHAGNPLLISLELLEERGWLGIRQDNHQNFHQSAHQSAHQNYLQNHFQNKASVGEYHEFHKECLKKARIGFLENASSAEKDDFDNFISQHSYWINDYALFQTLRTQFETHWIEWPSQWRDLRKGAGTTEYKLSKQNEDVYQQVLFDQYIVFSQWHALRQYANDQDVLLFGDVPIFVAYDSADVWANRDQFLLDEAGNPNVVAGVPPDYFSETGQRWGNPLFNWKVMQEDGFRWWIDRMRTQLELFDLVRVDHFRGFESYWEIAADCETAIEGHWVKAPGDELFQTLKKAYHSLPVIAEDLGLITPEVIALREKYDFPGMKILQFAFDSDSENLYLPHHHEPNCVVYTGTHDNDTTVGWFTSLAPDKQDHIMAYLDYPKEAMPWPLVQMAFNSVAELAIIPMQDVLALDSQHRMNTPGTMSDKNWHWQFSW